MTYPEAIDFLFSSLPVWERAGAAAYKPGLERIGAFVAALRLEEPRPDRFSSEWRSGHARHGKSTEDSTETYSLGRFSGSAAASPPLSRKPQFIHVAGTNGKGSTCHLLAAVLQRAGYRTGLFTSPHLVDFRERIRIDGAMIPEEAVAEFTGRWHDEMVASGLSFFEMTTAMALWWFSRSGCDVAIIETGLGGRLDSTNIVTPLVGVITNIGLEHTQYLGDTLAAIAAEKAGIIKAGVPVVIGESDPETEPVFRARAAELGSEIVFADKNNASAAERRPSPKAGGVADSRVSGRRAERAEHCAAAAMAASCEGDNVSETERRPSPKAGEASCEGDNYPLSIIHYPLDLCGDYQQKNLATVLATIDILRRTKHFS